MAVDQTQAFLQFALRVVTLWAVMVIAIKGCRMLAKPRGTYGKGLPERRRRPRMALPDPATLHPRPVPPGETI